MTQVQDTSGTSWEIADTLPSHGILSGPEIAKLIQMGAIQYASMEGVNTASLDLHLGDRFMVEAPPELHTATLPKGGHVAGQALVTLEKGAEHSPNLVQTEGGIILAPGEFCLAETKEVFHLPDTISADIRLRSTAARRGYDHAFASWCDGGWHGSVLTLEIRNNSKYHYLRLLPGERLVQMIFQAHSNPGMYGYSKKGRYNNSKTVETGK
jgi:dCTP deaminase